MSVPDDSFEAFVQRLFEEPGVTIASVCRATPEEIESKRPCWDRLANAAQTNQLPPEPRPEAFPRFSLEMPATTGATILTEVPIGYGHRRKGR